MQRVLALTPETELIADIRDTLKSQFPIEITACVDQLDFLENFQKKHSELVILDIDYLDKQTTKMMRILKNMGKDCEFILLLSEKKITICSEALSIGVFTYLIKPVSVKNAVNIISAALRMGELGSG